MLSVDVNTIVGNFKLHAKFESEGLVTVVFGRSGTGKTTLINVISGLQRPLSGHVQVRDAEFYNSEESIDLPVRLRRVGYVFQEGRLFPHLSVRKNLTFASWACGRKPDRSFDEVAGLLGLEDLLDRTPNTLSGGEKQRVAIGRALLSQPRVLVLDEPLASLDDSRKLEILPYLERLCKETGIPIVYVSHAVGEVVRLADHLVILGDGGVVASGPVEEALTRLDLGTVTNRFETSAVLNAKIIDFDERWKLTIMEVEGQRIELPEIGRKIGETVRLRVPARDVSLAVSKPTGISIRNHLAGEIIEMSNEHGPFVEIVCAIGEQRMLARLTKASVNELGLSAGSKVHILIKSVSFDHKLD